MNLVITFALYIHMYFVYNATARLLLRTVEYGLILRHDSAMGDGPKKAKRGIRKYAELVLASFWVESLVPLREQ